LSSFSEPNLGKKCTYNNLISSKKNYLSNNSANSYHIHDVGAANAYLALQAAEMGFQVHQMGGFDVEKTISTFNLNQEIETPVTFIAVGYQAEADILPQNIREMELKPRTRKAISDFLKKF
jgi:nitroreductase